MPDKILVVDDEREISDLVELYLQNENYEVFKFYSAKEALACIESTELDLAILDIMLPEINGFDLCKKIRAQYTYPVIMLTAKGNTAILHADEDLTLCGDPMKLARVFNNILKNAAAYSFPNSEIVISAWQQNDQMVISFENQGPTIPAESLSMIFERFYRMDAARNSDAG